MAQIVDFDPDDLRIVEQAISGNTSYSWAEIYSEWKDWVLADPIARGKHAPAFLQVLGGEDRGGAQDRLGSTFFLGNGWKFRPAEYSHHVILTGNIVVMPAGEMAWVPTLGSFTVGVQLESAANVYTVAVGSGVLPTDVTAIAAASRDAILTDATPFAGARIDAAVSSRATPGQGLTSEQATQLVEMWRLQGLDLANPLVVAALSRVAGTIEQTIAEVAGVVTVTRQP